MNDVPTILDDTRKIDAIWFFPEGGDGLNGFCSSNKPGSAYFCDEIRAYAENGQCAPVPFFAVYRDGKIIARVPAHMVEVRYA